ncbi:MAG: DMT family transporter [candidate division Zixibacteria bacterium]|nr:DMT family transporter [candidate division Zixibacteria bacterium]
MKNVAVDSLSAKQYSNQFIIFVLIGQQFFGALAFPISKYGLNIIEPFTFAFYRFLISSILLLLLVKIQKPKPDVEKKDYWKIISLGLLIIPLNQILFLYGQKYTSAGHGALLFATIPIWIFLNAIIILKEKIIWRRMIGIIVAMVGVIIIMFSGAIEFGKEYLFGDSLILIAVIAWSYYTIIGKHLVQKYGAIRVTTYALVSGSLVYFPFGLYMALKFDYSQATLGGWASVFYMAVMTSIVVYVLWYWVLKYMDASRIAVFHNLQPVLASVVAFLWLNEPVGWSFVIGGSIALLGVVIAET